MAQGVSDARVDSQLLLWRQRAPNCKSLLQQGPQVAPPSLRHGSPLCRSEHGCVSGWHGAVTASQECNQVATGAFSISHPLATPLKYLFVSVSHEAQELLKRPRPKLDQYAEHPPAHCEQGSQLPTARSSHPSSCRGYQPKTNSLILLHVVREGSGTTAACTCGTRACWCSRAMHQGSRQMFHTCPCHSPVSQHIRMCQSGNAAQQALGKPAMTDAAPPRPNPTYLCAAGINHVRPHGRGLGQRQRIAARSTAAVGKVPLNRCTMRCCQGGNAHHHRR